MAIDRPDDRHGAELVGKRQRDRVEQRVVGQLRRAAALRPDRVADQRRHAVGDHVDRGAGNDLVGALVDRGVAVDQRHPDRRGDAREQPEPGAAGEGRDAAPAKAPVSILPSRPMSTTPERSDHRPAKQARISGTPSRMPEPKMTDEGVEQLHARGPQIGGWVVRRASSVATGRRNMCSSAPANSTTRPWITMIMSRLIFGLSNASSAPP